MIFLKDYSYFESIMTSDVSIRHTCDVVYGSCIDRINEYFSGSSAIGGRAGATAVCFPFSRRGTADEIIIRKNIYHKFAYIEQLKEMIYRYKLVKSKCLFVTLN